MKDPQIVRGAYLLGLLHMNQCQEIERGQQVIDLSMDLRIQTEFKTLRSSLGQRRKIRWLALCFNFRQYALLAFTTKAFGNQGYRHTLLIITQSDNE